MNGANQDEVIYWIDPTNGDIWERTGGCSQCGDCCEEEGNGFSVIDGNGQPNPVEKVVEGKCAYFRWENDGKCSCAGMNTRYYLIGQIVHMFLRKLISYGDKDMDFKTDKCGRY